MSENPSSPDRKGNQSVPRQEAPRRTGILAIAEAGIIAVLVVIIIVLAVIQPFGSSTGEADGFTGVKVYTDTGIDWNGHYTVSKGVGDSRSADFIGTGYGKYTVDCRDGYMMTVSIGLKEYSWPPANMTAESWVRGEVRERNTMPLEEITEAVYVGAIC